jgi:hypothetical protein
MVKGTSISDMRRCSLLLVARLSGYTYGDRDYQSISACFGLTAERVT